MGGLPFWSRFKITGGDPLFFVHFVVELCREMVMMFKSSLYVYRVRVVCAHSVVIYFFVVIFWGEERRGILLTFFSSSWHGRT